MGRIGCEIHGLNLTHEMPVMETVAVVVSQNSSMIDMATLQIDVCQAVSDDISIFVPDLFLETRTLALPLERVDVGQSGLDRVSFLAHRDILPQPGHLTSSLNSLLISLTAGIYFAANCRSTYCRMPPCSKYSISCGVSIRTFASNSFTVPSAAEALTRSVRPPANLLASSVVSPAKS